MNGNGSRMLLSEELGELLQDARPVHQRHPPSFYCPISQSIMHDPVVLEDGHTYERRKIERWLRKHSTSPVSGLTLSRKDMFPNHALRNAIEEYFQEIQSQNRRAVWKSISEPHNDGLESHAPFLRTIDALMQCSLLMNADLSTDQVLSQIMAEARTLVGAEVASVFLLDEPRQELYSVVSSNGCEIRVPVTTGVGGHVATTGESVIVHDAYGDKRFASKVDTETGFRTRDMMCVPLKGKKGEIFGVVQLINKLGAKSSGDSMAVMDDESLDDAASVRFSKEDLQFLQVFASQAALAVLSSGFSLVREADTDSSPSASSVVDESGADKAQQGFCLAEAELAMEKTSTLDSTTSSESVDTTNPTTTRKSGRARQRAAKWWSKVRQRTPSPTPFSVDSY